jgi:hypothetical protein
MHVWYKYQGKELQIGYEADRRGRSHAQRALACPLASQQLERLAPAGVLRATFGTEDLSIVKEARAALVQTPVPSVDPVCLRRCGLE